MDDQMDNPQKTPAGENDEVQYSQLVKHKALNSLKNPPKVVAWTLSDFEEEERQQSQQANKIHQQKVDTAVEKTLAKEREALKKERFEQAYQEGYEKGFALGKEEGSQVGKSEAYSEAREFIFPKLQNLESMLDDLSSPYSNLESHLLEELAQFAVHLAEKIILFKIEESPEWLLASIEKTVNGLPENAQENKVEVFLNPEDLEFLKTLSDFSKEPYCHWKLLTDKSLPAGSCRVKQDFSTIHNDWHARFEQVKQEIMAQSSAQLAIDENISKNQPDANSVTDEKVETTAVAREDSSAVPTSND